MSRSRVFPGLKTIVIFTTGSPRLPFFQCLLLEFSCFYLGAQCEDGKEASAALSLASELMSRIETSGPDLPGISPANSTHTIII